jgi:drug/metabolite transporter (DMT)-like permease
MAAVLLALAAGVSWGVSDFLGGFNSRKMAVAAVLLISQSVGFLMMLPLAASRGGPLLDAQSAAFAAAGSASGLAGVACMYRGMAVGSVSIVAPISATGAAVPVVFGLLRGERASLAQSIGIVLTLIGVVLAARVSSKSEHSHAGAIGPGVGLALGAALGFGGFFVFLHEASTKDLLWAAALQRLTGVGLTGIAALMLRPSLAVGWAQLPALLAVGILDTTANVLYAGASTLGLVSLAAVLASLFPVVTVLLARLVLHERLSTSQGAGVVSALAGVALIAVQ